MKFPSWIGRWKILEELSQIHADGSLNACSWATLNQTPVDALQLDDRYIFFEKEFSCNDVEIVISNVGRVGFWQIYPKDPALLKDILILNQGCVVTRDGSSIKFDLSRLPRVEYTLRCSYLPIGYEVSLNENGGEILVLGSGHGRDMGLVRALYPESKVTGVEINGRLMPVSLNQLSALDVLNGVSSMHGISVLNQDIFLEAFDGKKYDLVLGLQRFLMHCASLEHLKDFARKLYSILNSGGRVVVDLSLPNQGLYKVLNDRTKSALANVEIQKILIGKVEAHNQKYGINLTAEQKKYQLERLVYDVPGNKSRYPLDLQTGGTPMPGYTRTVFTANEILEIFASAGFELVEKSRQQIYLSKDDVDSWMGVNSIFVNEDVDLLLMFFNSNYLNGELAFKINPLLSQYSEFLNRAVREMGPCFQDSEAVRQFFEKEVYCISPEEKRSLQYYNTYFTFEKIS